MPETSSSQQDHLLRLAQSEQTTPFDYIIVGSGAGGGPLAARLALGGKVVLLIGAGAIRQKALHRQPFRRANREK